MGAGTDIKRALSRGLRRALWGRPGILRVALSIGAGAGLAVLAMNSPVWWLAVALVLVLRTHLGSVLLGWCAGWVAMPYLARTFEARGAEVLRESPAMWRHLLGQPVVCYLDLNRAVTMGHAVCALELALTLAVVVLIVGFLMRLWARRHAGVQQ